MNNNWQNKIQQHTATPPEGVWMNIAKILDETELVQKDDFTVKIQQFETVPPENALKNIFTALDREKKFADRLLNYEETPPSAIWPAISNELNNTAKVISLKDNSKTIKSFYTKIAAAAILLIIAGAVWLNTNNKKITTSETVAVQPLQQQIKKTQAGTDSTFLLTPEAKQNNSTIATTKSVPAKSLNPSSTVNTIVNNTDFIANENTTDLAINPSLAPKEKLQNSEGETPMDIALMNTPNSYISISGPDGQMIKVSSKFSNLISYLTEDSGTMENLDIIIKESAKWRATFAKWRSKMANNTVAPSVTNFMDIIELSSVLEEKDK